ncbi:MAG: hypothetical protein EOR34_10770 [Mesorhizobium sp.]|uniref:hypothetical protein n=1 Tax=Mesorhizobium sp. TaxID=1871066 RepID=UPI000FE5287E|nr:hypothetical protein [Mesorhizobium sp.]RWI48376.1 MAG: hypothetical protein EOR15_13520 [Mesorhizobium sp.]RWI88127.1 MAG: hypothetical protein EOR20_03575 [Mesorhizobium sp.]RWJ60115.1 MAG: hypothetical protein EOR32_19690 [Mesorhizobium sp.]RWJ74365.1 MAG: hypothetical protein EOR34_10770 [Mesorhizobium sp.]
MDDALEPNVRLKAERDAYKLACERAGVCMSCVVQAPETYGCPDCMNTGWQQGDPYERIKQLEGSAEPPLAYLVRNPMVPRTPLVKAQPKFPQLDQWLYPAEREADARNFARWMRAELVPLRGNGELKDG